MLRPMAIQSPAATLARRSTATVLGVAWLGLALASASAVGAPADDDPIGRLLAQRGLVSGAAVAESGPRRDRAAELVVAALNFLDRPYKWGGSSASEGFDCSGFTRYMFQTSLGWLLPRRAAEQANQHGLIEVAESNLKPGDLVFFNTLRRAFSHVGIYIGNGKFIHAPREGAEVRLENMRAAYWARRYDGARRVPDVVTSQAAATAGGARLAGAGQSDSP
jgi:cell wall-associated NlpC family hydrolase